MVDNPRKEKTAVGLARAAAKLIKMRKGRDSSDSKSLRTSFGPEGHEDNPIDVSREEAAELRAITERRKQGKEKYHGPFTADEFLKRLDGDKPSIQDALRSIGVSPR